MRKNFTEGQALSSIPGRRRRGRGRGSDRHTILRGRIKYPSSGTKGQSKVLHHHIRTWGWTHVFRVAMRQRHSPSLVLLFLCLKLPNILSHKYCNNNTQRHNVCVSCFISTVCELLTCGLAAWSMIFKSRLWSWSRTWSFASPNRSIRLGSTDEGRNQGNENVNKQAFFSQNSHRKVGILPKWDAGEKKKKPSPVPMWPLNLSCSLVTSADTRSKPNSVT